MALQSEQSNLNLPYRSEAKMTSLQSLYKSLQLDMCTEQYMGGYKFTNALASQVEPVMVVSHLHFMCHIHSHCLPLPSLLVHRFLNKEISLFSPSQVHDRWYVAS